MAYNPSPYTITGNLPFGSVPGMMDYSGAYQNALNLNQANYQNIMAGYQGLQGAVLGDIQGIDASQRQQIADSYAQQSGAATQNMISHGLGNSTVQSAVQRGLSFDKTKADISLTNQTQGLTAGYRSNLGLAQLGFMNSVSAPYPDASAYARLNMMQGAINAANQRRYPIPQGGYGTAGGRVNMPTGFGMGGMGGMQGVGGNMGYGGGGYGGGGDSYSRPAGQVTGGYASNVYDDNWNVIGGTGQAGGGGYPEGGDASYGIGPGQEAVYGGGYPEDDWTGGSSYGDF